MDDNSFSFEMTDEHKAVIKLDTKPKPVMPPDFESRVKTAAIEAENKVIADEIATFMKMRGRSRYLPNPELECPFVASMCWAAHHVGPKRVMEAFKGSFENMYRMSWHPVMSRLEVEHAPTVITGMADLVFCDEFMKDVARGWGLLFDASSHGINDTLMLIKKTKEAKVDIIKAEQYFMELFDKVVFHGHPNALKVAMRQVSDSSKQVLFELCRDHKIAVPKLKSVVKITDEVETRSVPTDPSCFNF
jgi:hypothetical protein